MSGAQIGLLRSFNAKQPLFVRLFLGTSKGTCSEPPSVNVEHRLQQDILVQEQQGVESLVLGGGRNVALLRAYLGGAAILI